MEIELPSSDSGQRVTYISYTGVHTSHSLILDGIVVDGYSYETTRFCSLDNICFGQLATNLF